MRKWTVRGLAAIVALATFAPIGGQATQSSYADHLIARVGDAAERLGMDRTEALKVTQTVRQLRADGTVVERRMSGTDAIRFVTRGYGMPAPAEQGYIGPAEYNVGDLAHVYLHIDFGGNVQSLYRVTQSAVVPARPGPAVGYSDDNIELYEMGGKLTQVKGTGWVDSLHTVGWYWDPEFQQGTGWNVDTGKNGPYTPLDGRGPDNLVTDVSIDFLGYVFGFFQIQFCFPGFGCIAIIEQFIGDGATQFDNTQPATAFPIVP